MVICSGKSGVMSAVYALSMIGLMGFCNNAPAEELTFDLNASGLNKDLETTMKTLIADECGKIANYHAAQRKTAIQGPYLSLGISDDKTSVSIQIDLAELDPSGETTVGDQRLRSLTTVNYYIAAWDKHSAADQLELLTSVIDGNLRVILTHFPSKHAP